MTTTRIPNAAIERALRRTTAPTARAYAPSPSWKARLKPRKNAFLWSAGGALRSRIAQSAGLRVSALIELKTVAAAIVRPNCR